jgi:hypothetical protein
MIKGLLPTHSVFLFNFETFSNKVLAFLGDNAVKINAL